MKKLIIVLPGTLPVPTTKGGAVESLVFNLVKQNEISKRFLIVIFSPFEKNAFLLCKNYNYTVFNFVKSSQFELFLYKIFRKLFYSILPNDIFHFKVPFKICKLSYDEIILENRPEAARFYSKILKKKINLHVHNDTFNSSNFYKNYDLYIKKAITVSNYMTGVVSNYIPKNKIFTLYNCSNFVFDIKKRALSRTKLIKKYSIMDNEKVIFFSGRLVKEKGILELIKAFQLVDLPCKLFVAGSFWFGSNKKTDFIEELQDLGKKVKNEIIFLGYVNNSDLEDYYHLADFVVVPSIWEEPGALVVVESISLGKPLIITKSGGIIEYINPNGSIIVEKDKDLIESLSKSIEYLLLNTSLLERMSLVNLKHSKNFTQLTYYNNFMKIMFLNDKY